MRYIIIDDFNDTINIVCKDDDSGEPLIFDSYSETNDQIDEVAQNGMIISLDEPVYTLKQVLDILVCWEQTLNPETFKTSRGLDTIDFLDAARCKAHELTIEYLFDNALKEAGQDGIN